MKNNILLYGGKSTAFIVYEMLKDKKKKLNIYLTNLSKNQILIINQNFQIRKEI